MKATTEFEIRVSGGRIVDAEVPDGYYKLVKVPEEDDVFILIEASKLSLEDNFMRYQPRTEEQQRLKKAIENVIWRGVKDFYRPKYDPSFNKSSDGIYYRPGEKPAVGKSYDWWKYVAEEFKPECKSRLGTRYEYIAFLAVLIKKLVESGWTAKNAWYAVCNDSDELGHYTNSENAKHALEDTGCRKICGFFDLANTCKILTDDKENNDFWLVSGNYCNVSYYCQLFSFSQHKDYLCSLSHCVGWLVFESNPNL